MPDTAVATASADRCYRCCAPIGPEAAVHRAPGRSPFALCATCDRNARNPPPPPQHAEAATFGPALNAVMAVRNDVTMGTAAVEVSAAIRSLLARFERQRAAVPLYGYEHHPSALFDLIVPRPPSAQYRAECIAALERGG